MIAVLDTWPEADGERPAYGSRDLRGLVQLSDFRARHPESRGNLRLTEAISGQLVAPERIYHFVNQSVQHERRCPAYGCVSFLEDEYDLSSHGLFVTDVARDIAPSATLSVYRVMSRWGEGTMTDIACAIEAAIAQARAASMKLVINVSLGVGPPPWLAEVILDDEACFIDEAGYARFVDRARRTRKDWHFTDAEHQERKSTGRRTYHGKILGAEIVDGGRRFTRSLFVADMLLSVRDLPDVLLVAAAGNDSCDGESRMGPRLPAALDGALAVSAYMRTDSAATDMRIAGYSNDDDCFPRNDGIGAFGGNVEQSNGTLDLLGQSQMPERYSATDPESCLVGLYVADKYPPGGARQGSSDNTTGWARWAGTSFATPVAAGFAACLWSENLDLSAHGVRDSIVYERDGTERALEYLPFVQE